MQYFIDRPSRKVIVMTPGTKSSPREVVVDAGVARSCNLTPGQVLTVQPMGYLLDGSISAFNASIAGGAGSFGAATHWSEQIRDVPPRRAASASRAHSVAAIVEIMSWIYLVLCIIGGVVLTQQDKNYSGGLNSAFVILGLEIAIGGSFSALVMIMFASYIGSRTE